MYLTVKKTYRCWLIPPTRAELYSCAHTQTQIHPPTPLYFCVNFSPESQKKKKCEKVKIISRLGTYAIPKF